MSTYSSWMTNFTVENKSAAPHTQENIQMKKENSKEIIILPNGIENIRWMTILI